MTILSACPKASWANDLIARLTHIWKENSHNPLKPTCLSSRPICKEPPTPPNTAVSTSPRHITPNPYKTTAPTCTIKHATRRPQTEECPICTESLLDIPVEELVWCKGSCGRNIHRDCFELWKQYSERVVRCVIWFV